MTDSDLSAVAPASAGPRVSWSTILTIAAFSAITVYATAASLHTIDVDTGVVAAEMSLSEYRQLVAGERGHPYQWRMLGTFLVYGGERLTGLPPHAVDIALKTVLLWASTLGGIVKSIKHVQGEKDVSTPCSSLTDNPAGSANCERLVFTRR